MKHRWLRTGFVCMAALACAGQAWSAADTASSGVAGAAARPSGPDVVTLNFVNADIEGVVKAVSEITGKNFVLDPRVKGTVNIVSAKPMSRALVYQVFLSALRLQGFAAVEDRGMVMIVPEIDAKLHRSPTLGPQDQARGGQIIETQVFKLQHESAAQLMPVLRPLITPNNTITAYQNNNTLVVTDYANNLQRIAKIIETIDQPTDTDSIMIPLEHASALDVAQTITRLLAEPTQAADPSSRLTIAADARSNSVLARAGDPARLRRVRELAAMLDTPTSAGGNIHVIYLKNADATKLADVLRAIYSGESVSAPAHAPTPLGATAPGQAPAPAASSKPGIIQADAATNSLIITAPDAIYNNLRATVEKLDVRQAQVYVEALIAEVSANKAAELGVQWQDLSAAGKNTAQVIGGTNFGNAGQNILGISQNPTAAAQGLNIGVMKGTVTVGGRADPQPRPAGARARDGREREHPVDADAADPRQRGSKNRDRAERPVHYRLLRGVGCGHHADPVPDHRAQGRRHHAENQAADLLRATRCGCRSRRRCPASDSSTNPAGIITNKRSVDSTVLVNDGQIIVIGGLIQDTVNDGGEQGSGAGRPPADRQPVPLQHALAQQDQPHGVPAADGAAQRRARRCAHQRPLRLHPGRAAQGQTFGNRHFRFRIAQPAAAQRRAGA